MGEPALQWRPLQLKLFSPAHHVDSGGSAAGHGPDMSATPPPLTLRDAFERYRLPRMRKQKAAASTLVAIRQTVTLFERFANDLSNELVAYLIDREPAEWARIVAESVGLVSGSGITSTTSHAQSGQVWDFRQVQNITDDVLESFVDWATASGYSASTVNKHLRNLRAIFRAIGPRETGNPRGRNLIGTVPSVPSEPEERASPKPLTLERLSALYDACRLMEWPAHSAAPASLVWQVYLLLLLTHGYRVEDGRSIRGEHLHLAARCPDPNSPSTNAAGWIDYAPAKTRKHGRRTVLPLHPVVRAHIDRLLAYRGGVLPAYRLLVEMRGRVSTRLAAWHRLRAAAGCEGVDLADFRKTANNAHNATVPGIGEHVLGHAPRGTNATWYTRVEADLIRAMAEFPLIPNGAR